jgi:hypothetical protein
MIIRSAVSLSSPPPSDELRSTPIRRTAIDSALSGLRLAAKCSSSAALSSFFIPSAFLAFSNIKTQGLTMQFEGKLQNISILLNALESFPLTININSFAISQKRVNSQGNEKISLIQNDLMYLNINGEFYFWNTSN